MLSNQKVITCEKGWETLYKPIIERIMNFDRPKTNVLQKLGVSKVSQENGKLNIEVFHPEILPPSFASMIKRAEENSEKTCEFCGKTEYVGYVYTRLGKRTCCHNCYENNIRVEFPASAWKNGTE